MFEIGNSLREARVGRNISLQQAEEDTKIRVKYVQAMENEDFDILPAGTYVKGFLRTYAEYLGLDYQVLIDEYNERFGTGEHREHIIHQHNMAKTVKTEAAPRRRQTNYFLVAIIAVVIIAVLAYLGWGNPSSEEPVVATTNASTTATQTSTAESVLTTPADTTPVIPVPEPVVLESLTITATTEVVDITVTRDEKKGPELIKATLQPGESLSLTGDQLQGLDRVWVDARNSTLEVVINGTVQVLPEFDPTNDYLVLTLNGITTEPA
jgi:cytoskeletal protein RodZ